MSVNSAGLLIYRINKGQLEVLLVHPGGPFWANKDEGVWSIPKGEFENNENPLEAAKREFKEETGFDVTGVFHPLGSSRQSSGKTVYVWAVGGDFDPVAVNSNTFVMKWPRGSDRDVVFPEVDKADWFTLDKAQRKIIRGQTVFLQRLKNIIM